MLEQYHTTVPLEKTNLPTVEARRLWKPGEPIPRDCAPDPHEALERHAAAHAMDEQRRRFNGRRQTRPADRRAA